MYIYTYICICHAHIYTYIYILYVHMYINIDRLTSRSHDRLHDALNPRTGSKAMPMPGQGKPSWSGAPGGPGELPGCKLCTYTCTYLFVYTYAYVNVYANT